MANYKIQVVEGITKWHYRLVRPNVFGKVKILMSSEDYSTKNVAVSSAKKVAKRNGFDFEVVN